MVAIIMVLGCLIPVFSQTPIDTEPTGSVFDGKAASLFSGHAEASI